MSTLYELVLEHYSAECIHPFCDRKHDCTCFDKLYCGNYKPKVEEVI